MSALLAARAEGGVLPPAQFGFLKLVDRRLWYALHSLGYPADMFDPLLHPTPLVEAIGARDHWAAELVAGAPLRTAAIDNALAAVRKV
jgi:intracellular multiplication protein IcmP